VPLVVAFGLGQLVWTVLVWVRPAYESAEGLLHRPAAYHVAMLLAGAVALLVWYLLLRSRLGPAALAVGGLVWPALLAVVCAALAPGASFLFVMPVLFATAGYVAALLLNRPLWSIGAVGLGLVVGAALLLYFGYMVFIAVGLALGGAGPVFVVLFGLLALPVVELLLPSARRGAVLVPSVAAVLAVVAVAAGVVIDRPDADHPAASHLAYVLDADDGKAYWVSADREPARWTARYVHGTDARDLPPGYARGDLWTGRAPALDLDGPEVEVLSRTGGTVTFRVTSRREAPRLTLRLDAPVTRVTATAPGREPAMVAVAGTRTDTWPAEIRFRDLPAAGVELIVHTRATRVTALDETRGLTDVPGFRPRPPGLTAAPRDDVDLLSVARTYDLEP
jgi:hypothetical protein